MAPAKWDDKRERDLLFAMRIAEHGYNPMSMKTWAKAANIMNMMGYQDATDTGVSQRWSKVILKEFQKQHPEAPANAADTAAAGPATATAAATGSNSAAGLNIAPAPIRVPRGRTQKRKRAQEVEEDDDDEEEVTLKKAPAAKKQKQHKNLAAKKEDDEDAEDADNKAYGDTARSS